MLLQVSRSSLPLLCKHLQVSDTDIETVRKVITSDQHFFKQEEDGLKTITWKNEVDDWLAAASAGVKSTSNEFA